MAVTRGVSWVFEHPPKFQGKLDTQKQIYYGVSFCSKDCFYAFYKLGNAPKSVSAGASPRTPLEKLTALPRTPSWWGVGSPRPSQEPPPSSGFGHTGYAVSSHNTPRK